jgi:hypothetical protein
MRRWVWVVLLVFCVFYVATQPHAAAQTFHAGLHGLRQAADAFAQFIHAASS